MKKIKYRYQLPPCSIYDVPAMEAWLTDLAHKGLYVKKAGGRLFAFAYEEPSDTCYRLEPAANDSGKKLPPCDMQDDYANAGWEFAAVLQKSFFIWHSLRPDADELHSDPLIHSSAYEQIFRRLRTNAVSTTLLALVTLAMYVCGMLLSPQPVTLFLASPSMPLLVAFNLISCIQAGKQFYDIYRLKRSLAGGFPASHRKNYRRGLILRRTADIFTILLAFALVAMPAGMFANNWKKSIPEISQAIPYLPLNLLEQGQDFSWHHDSYIRNGVDAYNYAEFSWTLFVPAHYEVYQQGEPNSIWQNKDKDAIATVPSAHTEYFRVAFPCLAASLYQEQLRRAARYGTSPVMTELSHPGFDRVTTAVSEGLTQLFARRGSQVIHIEYWGSGNLTDKLDLLAEVFE